MLRENYQTSLIQAEPGLPIIFQQADIPIIELIVSDPQYLQHKSIILGLYFYEPNFQETIIGQGALKLSDIVNRNDEKLRWSNGD
mmetsp:Transcript_11316/g.1695  ORF Transcript_11316/g.1695 Transcript_11316/m.1695 type:complete len:85 (+) Transcript_11316:177-431(+)